MAEDNKKEVPFYDLVDLTNFKSVNDTYLQGKKEGTYVRHENLFLVRIVTREDKETENTIHEVEIPLWKEKTLRLSRLGDTVRVEGKITPEKRIESTDFFNVTLYEKSHRRESLPALKSSTITDDEH